MSAQSTVKSNSAFVFEILINLFKFFLNSWFFENVSRKEADKLLLAEENPRGTFLIRPSEHNPNGFSLR